MGDKDRIATYYSNARELVKQNNPKAARAYVLAILNNAVKTYYGAKTILLKVRTQAFLDKWIAVSRDLYSKGITDYVLECFGLLTKAEQDLPKVVKQPVKPENKPKKQPAVRAAEPPKASDSDGDIDIAGLIDEAAAAATSGETFGWCADVFEKNKNAVVQVYGNNDETGSTGTGFIISANGYLLTNDHVVFDGDNNCYYPKLKMALYGDKKSYAVQVLFSDKKADVALLSFNSNAVASFGVVKRIADYATLKQGADCLVIGNAVDMGIAPFTGVVRFTKNFNGDLVYTCPSNPGDSGGPVFDRLGECIGINKSKTKTVDDVEVEGYTNATPMDKIAELLKKWCDANGIEL